MVILLALIMAGCPPPEEPEPPTPLATYTVTYDGNGNTGGWVPTDGNNYVVRQTVTVLGDTGTLVKTNFVFGGWNTASDGSGTTYAQDDTFAMGFADVTLYAKWSAFEFIAAAAAEANIWSSVTYGNGLFVAVAFSGSGTNRVMTSPDGVTWTARAAAEANYWFSVTYGNGLFVAVAEDGTNQVMYAEWVP